MIRESDEQSITCPACGATSYNRNDIREGYCGRCHRYTTATPGGSLMMWTIYERPDDYPEFFVIRPWIISAGSTHPGRPLLYATLGEARESLEPMGLVRLERQEGDDPKIVETWV